MSRRIVVALGGNAILQAHQRGTAEEQAENLRLACRHLVPLVQDGDRLVLTHGNGPQVGNLLIQQEEASALVPEQPMSICVAMTQGQIGSMLQQAFSNELQAAGIQLEVVTLISHFIVDRDDADFKMLSKPVGPFLTDAMRVQYETQRGHVVRKVGRDPDRPYRRVVASPRPLRLLEKRAAKTFVDAGVVVVTAGGGGIPVLLEEDGTTRAVDAVIDKDLGGEKLAEAVGADLYLILTDVDGVYLDYGTDQQRLVPRLTLDKARELFRAGQFSRGSMGPKVLAAIQFIEYGGEAAVIGPLERAADAVRGMAGTRIER